MEIDVIPDKIEKEIILTLQQIQIAVASLQEVIANLNGLIEQIKKNGIIIRSGV